MKSAIKIKLILLCFINLGVLYSQTDSVQTTQSSSTFQMKIKDVFVGVDLFNPIYSALSDKAGGAGFISARIHKKWHGILEVGYEKNTYDDLGWKVDASGTYFKLGFNWQINNEPDLLNSGFMLGAKVAYSPYTQEIKQYPIRPIDSTQTLQYGSFPKANVGAFWFELSFGGRVQIGKGPFYGELAIQPKYIIANRKQDDIDNLVIPGFGKDRGGFNLSLFWGISVKL